jgi:hypothetical protein
MTWDAPTGAFLGEPFSGPYPFRVALEVTSATLQLRDGTGNVLGALPLPGETLERGYAWLRGGLAHYMGEVPEIDAPDFEIPAHRVGEGARFSQGRDPEHAALAALYASAAALLTEVAATGPAGSSVRCWPHHFDIATLLTVRAAKGDEPARTVGVGMAPAGGGYDAWYWYVTPWPYPDPGTLPSLPGGGHWHTEAWVGAVLPGETVVGCDPGHRSRMVGDFVRSAVGASVNAMGG